MLSTVILLPFFLNIAIAFLCPATLLRIPSNAAAVVSGSSEKKKQSTTGSGGPQPTVQKNQGKHSSSTGDSTEAAAASDSEKQKGSPSPQPTVQKIRGISSSDLNEAAAASEFAAAAVSDHLEKKRGRALTQPPTPTHQTGKCLSFSFIHSSFVSYTLLFLTLQEPSAKKSRVMPSVDSTFTIAASSSTTREGPNWREKTIKTPKDRGISDKQAKVTANTPIWACPNATDSRSACVFALCTWCKIEEESSEDLGRTYASRRGNKTTETTGVCNHCIQSLVPYHDSKFLKNKKYLDDHDFPQCCQKCKFSFI